MRWYTMFIIHNGASHHVTLTDFGYMLHHARVLNYDTWAIFRDNDGQLLAWRKYE